MGKLNSWQWVVGSKKNGTIYYLTQNLTSDPSPMERGEKMVQCPPLHRRGVGGEVLRVKSNLRQIVDNSEKKYELNCEVIPLLLPTTHYLLPTTYLPI